MLRCSVLSRHHRLGIFQDVHRGPYQAMAKKLASAYGHPHVLYGAMEKLLIDCDTLLYCLGWYGPITPSP